MGEPGLEPTQSGFASVFICSCCHSAGEPRTVPDAGETDGGRVRPPGFSQQVLSPLIFPGKARLNPTLLVPAQPEAARMEGAELTGGG